MEKELTGREEEPSELIYFKVYKSQTPVIEPASETAALMLGTDESRGYCLDMAHVGAVPVAPSRGNRGALRLGSSSFA